MSILFLKKNNTIIAVHDVIPHKKIQNRKLVKLLDNIIFNFFDNFHFFSEVQMRAFKTRFNKKNTFFAPLMLKNSGPKKEKIFTDEKIEFLFFGVIDYYKGLDILLKATTKLIHNGITNFRLTIAGKGEFWKECEKLIVHKKYYNCKIRFIANSEIPDLFSKIHYLVLPYRDVTQSGALFTSYFYETPIIAPNYEEFKTYIKDGNNGYLYEKNDENDLYNSLKRVINKHSKYDLIQKKNKVFIENKFDEKKIIKLYNKFLNQI